MKTPAGLLDGNFEWFSEDGETLYGILNGRLLTFRQVPQNIIKIYNDEFIQDIDFILKNGSVITEALFIQWIIGKYGKLDSTPDYETATGKTNPEDYAVQMGLTSREMEVIEAIMVEDLDKTISSNLGISLDTLKTHKKNICRKLGTWRKSDIIKVALEMNLV